MTPVAPSTCSAPDDVTKLDRALPRVTAALAAGGALKIVAFGSSSTFGSGASTPAASYPCRLEAELRARFPGREIIVVNRGVGGEDAREMLARLDRDVAAEKPDLVLWQVGTNAVVNEHALAAEAELIRAGVSRLRATGADVVLIDPQYAPAIIAKPDAVRMVELLETIGREAGVPVFHRFAAMRRWREEQKLAFEHFLLADGLHMNDWSYDRMARLLAVALVDAAALPASMADASATCAREA